MQKNGNSSKRVLGVLGDAFALAMLDTVSPAAADAGASSDGVVTVRSDYPAAEIIARITADVAVQGMVWADGTTLTGYL